MNVTKKLRTGLRKIVILRLSKKYLDLIIDLIPKGARILDLGCSTGQPIAQYFIEKGFKITGVDGSLAMIKQCQQHFPNETWIVKDMCDINLLQTFDAIIAWHSFFHLEPDQQRKMMRVFESLYHASLSTEEYTALLATASFEILQHQVRDPDCGEATVWLA